MNPTSRRLRLLVCVLVALEAVALTAGAVIGVTAALTSDRDDPAALVFLALIALAVGAGLALCARGVLAGARWSRGPVLTWQLLQAGVAMPLSASGAWWAGVPLLAVAVVAGVLVVGRHVIVRDDLEA
jgi:hypothetical protein